MIRAHSSGTLWLPAIVLCFVTATLSPHLVELQLAGLCDVCISLGKNHVVDEGQVALGGQLNFGNEMEVRQSVVDFDRACRTAQSRGMMR